MGDVYDNPLIVRYASAEMAELWGPRRRFGLWRRLWLALAEAQQEMGLGIRDDQLAALRDHLDDIDLEKAARYERQLRHDVMAHVYTFGEVAPEARSILHWGATSCYVTDNADLILLRESMQLIARRLAAVIDRLASFATEHRALVCLGLTHLQPAQPTTVGKRVCLWIQDLVIDLEEIEHRLRQLRARSIKGTTGTQASFLEQFEGHADKVEELERRVARKMGFDQTYPVTGQTYPRKVDAQIVDALSGIGQSAHKAATDLRILASRKEMEEPFEQQQIGSSAMAYKRNPMRSERMCALGRLLISLPQNTAQTAATQWMERTLDDSANRRLVLPQAFLAADALLRLYLNVAAGLVVYPRVIQRYLNDELPFLATEAILMEAVRLGHDRQDVHEAIRRHSQAAAHRVKQEGQPNDLLGRLAGDPLFQNIPLESLMQAERFVGLAPRQVERFTDEVVQPIRQRYAGGPTPESDLHV
jgi:adenylosuccinate lyase